MMDRKISRPLGLALKRLGVDGAFAGYASVFGVLDAQGDRVAPGAFAASIARWKAAGQWPPFLWQHDPGEPIGRFDRLAEDVRGLAVEGRLALDTRRGREAHALLKLGAIDGLSIGYTPVAAAAGAAGSRLLRAVELHEISLVTLPANQAARVAWVKTAPPVPPPGRAEAILGNLRRAARVLRP